jgi:DNA-directed RNA polymerase subunit RPC12/RpoP
MMPQTFACPACGAPQESPTQAGQFSIHCPYCGHTVIVPEELRIPEEIEQPEPEPEITAEVLVNVASAMPAVATSLNRTARTILSCLVILAILFAIVTILVVPLLSAMKISSEKVDMLIPVGITLPAIITEANIAASGPAIDDQDNLYGMTRTRIYYYKLP